MTLKSHFQELDQALVFDWIEIIRSHGSTNYETDAAETALCEALSPISKWFAFLRSSTPGYDAEQVVIDSVCKFMLKYVRDRDFQFGSCGHIVTMLSQITTQKRRHAYRWNNRAKRAPHDGDGNLLLIESLDLVACTCKSNLDDPICICENSDEIDRYLSLLREDSHQRVLMLILADFTWSEIADELNVDLKTVRRWVDQMRRILKRHNSSLKPQASSLKPQASNDNPPRDL